MRHYVCHPEESLKILAISILNDTARSGEAASLDLEPGYVIG